MKIETHTMPAHWAGALINNDWSGLDGRKSQDLKEYLRDNPECFNPVSCSENPTIERFTFSPGVTLLTECLEYSFLRGE